MLVAWMSELKKRVEAMLRSSVRLSFLVLVVFLLQGCYHATVDTDLPASAEKIEKRWASAWIYGLVPPSTVETASECTNGVAQVDTQLSFTNQLVSFLTLGIYTPMEIIVTCASSSALIDGPTFAAGSSDEERVEAVMKAAELARETQESVYVKF